MSDVNSFQIHFVHFNTKYDQIGAAVAKPDGLMVMGFFMKVSLLFAVFGSEVHKDISFLS